MRGTQADRIESSARRSDQALFREARKYAEQLELIDPDNRSAEQEMAEVVLRLSYAETSQDRLDALTAEARRLKLAIAEAKRQCVANAKRPTNFMRYVKCVLTRQGGSDWWFLVSLAFLIAAWSTGVVSRARA